MPSSSLQGISEYFLNGKMNTPQKDYLVVFSTGGDEYLTPIPPFTFDHLSVLCLHLFIVLELCPLISFRFNWFLYAQAKKSQVFVPSLSRQKRCWLSLRLAMFLLYLPIIHSIVSLRGLFLQPQRFGKTWPIL